MREEETAGRNLALARAELSGSRQRLERSKLERLEYGAQTCAESSAGIPGEKLLEKRAIAIMLQRMIENEERQGLILEDGVDKQEKEWFKKRRARKILESLRDREKRRWLGRYEREEQKMIDEMAGVRFLRQSRQQGGVLGKVLLFLVAVLLGVGAWFGSRFAGSREISSLMGAGDSSLVSTTGEKATAPADEVNNATEEAVTQGDGRDYLLSASELTTTLNSVREQQEQIRLKTIELDNWDRSLQKRQKDVDAEVAKCEILRATVESELAELKELREWRTGEERKKKEADLQRLSKLYKEMSPKDAARMMEALPPDTAQDVLISMNARDAVAILSEIGKKEPALANTYLESISNNMENIGKGSARKAVAP